MAQAHLYLPALLDMGDTASLQVRVPRVNR